MTPWLKPALVGIDAPVDFGLEGEVGALLARLGEGADAALAYARGAAVLAACTRAATTPEAAAAAPPAAAAPDPQALSASHPWADALGAVFAASTLSLPYEVRLADEACRRLADAGKTLPAATLPAALTAGQRHAALRPVLMPVLGHRGRWLALQNPEWKFAAGPGADASAATDSAWEHGTAVDRSNHFRALRQRDPAAARALLQASLGELAAKERLEFVQALDPGLEAGDVGLLEPLLAKDRSRDVRFAAARLLARLPGTAHAQRLVAWIAPRLTQKRGLLGKSWNLDAPDAADPDWAAAQIEATRPQHEALGERAWWLYQLVRQVPLAWWTAHTGMSPGELVAWAGKGDWAAALHRGWRERVGAGEPEWVHALLAARPRDARAAGNDLLALLPVAQREPYWPGDVDSLWKSGEAHVVVAACAPGETLSRRYSAALLPTLYACFEDDRLRHDHGLRHVLLELAALLDAEAIGTPRLVARRADETPAMADAAHAFERLLHVRAALRAHP